MNFHLRVHVVCSLGIPGVLDPNKGKMVDVMTWRKNNKNTLGETYKVSVRIKSGFLEEIQIT